MTATAHPAASSAATTSAATSSGATSSAPTGADRQLTRVLALDAVASAATGALLAGGSGALDGVLGIPSGWLLGLGLFLLAYAADVALVATRYRRLTPAIVAANAAWVVASVLLVLAGGFELTLLGGAFVLAQAAVVAVFAVLQARALRG